MTSRDSHLDRLDYVEGSRILVEDLHESRANDARWRALHVRALHDTWGVATGLGVSLTPDRRGVVVGAGAAFDCRGRVIEMAEPVELPLPPPPALGLFVSTFDVVLGPAGVRWEPTAGGPAQLDFGKGVRVGIDVPLGRCTRSLWGMLSSPDYAVRKTVRPLTRSRVGFGVSPAGASWSSSPSSIWTYVDTSAAGFGSTPRYSAWIAQIPDLGGLIGPFLSLAAFHPQRFTVRLSAVSPAGLPALAVLASLRALAGEIRIGWMGVEPNAGCSSGGPGGFV